MFFMIHGVPRLAGMGLSLLRYNSQQNGILFVLFKQLQLSHIIYCQFLSLIVTTSKSVSCRVSTVGACKKKRQWQHGLEIRSVIAERLGAFLLSFSWRQCTWRYTISGQLFNFSESGSFGMLTVIFTVPEVDFKDAIVQFSPSDSHHTTRISYHFFGSTRWSLLPGATVILGRRLHCDVITYSSLVTAAGSAIEVRRVLEELRSWAVRKKLVVSGDDNATNR